jgi:hypothetical protein
MDLLQTMMNIPRSAGDLLASLAGQDQQGPQPTPGNPAEQIPGADQAWARQKYQQQYLAEMDEATRQGRSWMAAPNIARASADNTYASALQNSAQIVDVARQAREAAQARANYPQLLEQSAKELGLSPAQYATLKVLPPDQGIQELKDIAKLKYQNRQDIFSATPIGEGQVLITNKQDGTYQIVSGGGQTTKVTPHVLPDSTIAMIDKNGNVVSHVDPNGKAVTTSGAKPTAGVGAMTQPAADLLSSQLHSGDVNGLFSTTDAQGNTVDLLAPPAEFKAVPARTLATLKNAFANEPVIKDLKVRANEHANIVANINSPDSGPMDRAQKDLSLAYMFLHMLNPGVSVKEGEVDMLKQANPAFARLGINITKLINGQSLTPEQRQSILRESGVMAHGTIKLARNLIGQTAAQARSMGIHPGQIVSDPTAGMDFGDETGGLRSPSSGDHHGPDDRAAAAAALATRGIKVQGQQ